MKQVQCIWVVLAIVLGGAAGCAHLDTLFQRPTVNLRHVDLVQVSLSGMAAHFQFDVNNPNSVGISLASLRYQLTIDGHALAEGQGQHPLEVPAHGTGTLELPVAIRYADLAQSISAAVTKREIPYALGTHWGFQTPIGIIELPISSEGILAMPRPSLP